MEEDGHNCVERYDPSTGTAEHLMMDQAEWLRGIAVGLEKSKGFVWACDTSGTLFKVNADTLTLADSYSNVGVREMVGVAIDYEGYVWTVSEGGNAAHKFDPDTGTKIDVPIGKAPYTYSDMTGMQLNEVIIEK
jgi:streptogramin lyase